MINKAVLGAALFFALSPCAYADPPRNNDKGMGQFSAEDRKALTDARIGILKATLQLTPEQEKLWPPVEDAIRTRAKNRQERMAERAKLRDRSTIEIIRDRNPVKFLNRRADALAERSADLKKLAAAWEPLYTSLSQDQKRRMALLTIIVLRDLRDTIEERQMQAEDDDDYDDD